MNPIQARPSDVQRDSRGRALSWQGHPVAYAPHPGPQTAFFTTNAFEILYGGACGGGKSAAGVVGATRQIGRGYGSHYRALLLRREFPEMESSLIPETEKYYPALGGRYRSQKHYWVFPNGERVYLRAAQHRDDIRKLLSAEFQYVFFDELTTFLEYQYTYAISRMRSIRGIPVELRAGTNPGSQGHEWVFKRWAPWLNPDCPDHAKPGEVLWFAKGADELEHVVPKGTPKATSRTFIAARTTDNPSLDDDYTARLSALDPFTAKQLRDGDWLVQPGRGVFYKRPWFEVVDASPMAAARVRYWDKAGTEDDGDWTVGTKLARPTEPRFKGLWFVEDMRDGQWGPGDVLEEVTRAAHEDGKAVTVGMPLDPGAAGKFEVWQYVAELGGQGFAVSTYRETGDKITRQKPLSAQAFHHNIKVVRGPWNDRFFNMVEAFPDAGKDHVDSLAGAYEALTRHDAYNPPKPKPKATIASTMGGF